MQEKMNTVIFEHVLSSFVHVLFVILIPFFCAKLLTSDRFKNISKSIFRDLNISIGNGNVFVMLGIVIFLYISMLSIYIVLHPSSIGFLLSGA